MRVTTRSRYALLAIADVALRGGRGPVALSTISERHDISLSYLEMLFSALRRAGLVDSTRGPGGGYSLARNAQAISVADIVLAAEQGKNGQLDVDHGTMTAHQGAVTQGLWQAFNQTVLDHLSSISLADVVAEQSVAEHGATQTAEHSASGKPTSAVAPSNLRHRPSTPPKRQLPRDDVPNSVFALGYTVRTR